MSRAAGSRCPRTCVRRMCRSGIARRRGRHRVRLVGRTAVGGGQPGAQRHHPRPRAPHCTDRVPARSKRAGDHHRRQRMRTAGRRHSRVLGRFSRGSTAASGGSVWDLRWSPAGPPCGGPGSVVGQPAGWVRATLRITSGLPPRDLFCIPRRHCSSGVRPERIRKSRCGPAATAPAASPAATGP